MVCLKAFVALHNDSVISPSAYVVRKVLLQNLSHYTAIFILTYECQNEHVFSFVGFSAIMQYHKILHACITLIYMTIYFSHTVTQNITLALQ